MQFSLRSLLLVPVVLAIPCALIGAWLNDYNQNKRSWRAYERMETAILRLSVHCPSDLTDDQWAFCIAHTMGLHNNFTYFMPTTDLERIVEEFEGEIDASPSLTTIDWLWEEYYRSARGARDCEPDRPTSPANQSLLEAGIHSGNPLSMWRSMSERRVAKK